MIEISTLMGPDGVIPVLKAGSKKSVLEELAEQAALITGQRSRLIFDVLLERERLGSTGVGGGIAIPHGKLETLDRLYMVFGRTAQPVDFDAVDEQPVDLFCLLLAPAAAGADHLKALARISRLLRNVATCDKLRGATSGEAIYAILTEGENEKAA